MISESELREVLSKVGSMGSAGSFESEHLDFKEIADSPKKVFQSLADASVCFTNADGGTIVLGVNDKAETREEALLGVPEDYTVDVVRKAIFDRTRPSITAFAREYYEDGVRLLVVDVPPGVTVHSNSSGLATRRLGTECLPFTPDQQREVMTARGHIDWSSDPSGLPVSSLSEVEFGRLRRLLRQAGNDELAELRNDPLLAALRLIARDGSASNAAVLLLADEETLTQILPNYGYSYQYRPTPGSEAIARYRRTRPLLLAAEELIDSVSQRVSVHPLPLAGGVQLQLTDYPERAVREVVVNALIHRAYDAGGTVDVEHSSERLVVSNPGGLVAGVTPENILTHPSTPRNRLLAETVTRMQLAERTGQGIDRAYREMLRLGKEPPQFLDDGLLVQAVLNGGIGNDSFVRFVNELPEELARDVEVLLALSQLRNSTSISAADLAPVIQRSPSEAQEVLARMTEERFAIVEPTRRTVKKQYPNYRLRSEPLAALARAVSYRRRSLDQIDTKVIEHVREYGHVTNRTLQRLFDIHVYAARDLLNDLRNRGILEKVGEARGGPGVQYVAGPNFPIRLTEQPSPQPDDRPPQEESLF